MSKNIARDCGRRPSRRRCPPLTATPPSRTFKIGAHVPALQPLNVRLSKAAEQIKAQTGGK